MKNVTVHGFLPSKLIKPKMAILDKIITLSTMTKLCFTQ